MLKDAEKAYCRALDALSRKDYPEALRLFQSAAGQFEHNREFALLHEATRLLIGVKGELARFESGSTPPSLDDAQIDKFFDKLYELG